MRPSALACISISLAAAGARAGDVPPDPARVAALELETGLAKRPSVYLVLDPQRRVLEIKARGAVLDTVQLTGIEIISQQPLLTRDLPDHPPIPALWTIRNGPGDTDREVIAPSELRPAPKDDEEEEAEPTPPMPPTEPTPTPTPPPATPTSYRSRLANGWDLWITDRLPPQSLFETFIAAVKDGWSRLRGLAQDHPPAITLAMADDDARRIHHLMRSGTAILVASEI
ncbi:MAG TPA: hypothetical protein VMT45_13410 [Thermoanaerobaculaceae bacterium]|nr:hypothetical protein [Thermoanaerobaculaceae bacterium]